MIIVTMYNNMCCLFIVLFVNFASGFNFDINFPIVYTDPYNFSGSALDRSSYFGYSVLLYKGDENNAPWIQIGAPRGTNQYLANKATGVVFRCGIKTSCNQLKLVPTSTNGYPDEAFFGFNMDITADDSAYATCGPRWIYKHERNGYYMQGACFAGDTKSEASRFATPFKEKDDQVLNIASAENPQYAYNKAQGQVGFSIQFRKQSSELIVGVPGMLNWKGVPGILSQSHIVTPSRRRSKRDISELLTEVLVPQPVKFKEAKFFDLVGYSVTSGKFYDPMEYYVTGAPRANQKGTVLIFKFKSTDDGLDIKERKDGTQFGEYFGSSVTSSDINNDGLDDLIVGAPFHKSSDSKYDEGAIYIYVGSKDGLQAPSTSTITGKVSGGRFGESVMSLGDIDNDDFGDIAVAAPYENENSGVVYIFRGDKQSGLNREPAQKIIGKDIIPTIRGFGISLSKPADIDGNHYNDIAIGAYKSGHAVILRGKPIVNLKHTLTSSISQVQATDQFSFNVSSCIAFSGINIIPPIRIVRTISVDKDVPGRAYVEGSAPENAVLDKSGEEYCKIYTVRSIKANNFDTPIVIKASVDLQATTESKQVIYVGENVNGKDEFCKNCAILSPYDVNDRDKQVNVDFNRGCGADNICTSNLVLTSNFVNIDNALYVINNQSFITLQINVTNHKENAYQTEVHITLPDLVGLRSMPSYCKNSNSKISCSVDNPLKQDTMKTVALELDLTEVNTGKVQGPLEFLLSATTTSINEGDKDRVLSLELVKNADVELMGKSGEEIYSYENRTYGQTSFQQIFKVLKYDISPIQKVELDIQVPITISVGNKIVNFLSLFSAEGTLAGQSITCQVDAMIPTKVDSNLASTNDVDTLEKKKRKRRDVLEDPDELMQYPANRTIYINCTTPGITCANINCNLGPFKNDKHTAEIKLKLYLDISELADYQVDKDIVLLSTSASVKIIDSVSKGDSTHRHSVSVATVFIGPIDKSIAIWIIIVAIICGILLLAILAGVLYKMGFFKRTKKDQLIKEKAEKNAEGTMQPLHEDEA